MRLSRIGWFPFVIVVIFACGLSLLVIASYFQDILPHWLKHEILASLGDALIVAAVIAASVDPFIKSRLAKELSRNFLGYTIGWDIPKSFRERAEELLKGTAVIRKDFSIHYRLIFDTAHPESLTIETQVEYEVENLTSKSRPYELTHEFEESDSVEVVRMRCTSNDPVAEYDQPNPNPSEVHSKGRKRVLEYCVRPVDVQPKDRGFQYKFKYVFRFVRKIEDFESVYFGQTPISDVSIELDECPPDLEFVPDPGAVLSIGIPGRWTYGKAFFEGDHITVRWGKKPKQLALPDKPIAMPPAVLSESTHDR